MAYTFPLRAIALGLSQAKIVLALGAASTCSCSNDSGAVQDDAVVASSSAPSDSSPVVTGEPSASLPNTTPSGGVTQNPTSSAPGSTTAQASASSTDTAASASLVASASESVTDDTQPSTQASTSTQPSATTGNGDAGPTQGTGGVSDTNTTSDGEAGTGALDAGNPPQFDATYIMGADISGVPEQLDLGTTFIDTDGQEKDILDLLAAHGFNMIRLRTFVDPSAAYGYASDAGDCQAKTQPYNDAATTIAFAQQIKARGMGLLLDFHYSDTWADPGKQVIPEAWRDDSSIDDLATRVSAYTTLLLTELANVGATPDMVQVGNEITPGMLIHVPTDSTDCYGNNSTPTSGPSGSTANWDDLATLLTAGIDAVRAVDPNIRVMLHIENLDSPQGVVSWVNSARSRGVEFDVLGLSAYEAFQGPVSEWQDTFEMLANTFADLSFAVAEYNPERRLLNDIMRGLPAGRGVGTFFWEPTQSGTWGDAMFDFGAGSATARAEDFAEYDQMVADYGL